MTVWRWVRTKQVELDQLRHSLEIGIKKVEHSLEDLWLAPRAVSHLNQIANATNDLYNMSQNVMDWLVEKTWRDPEGRMRAEKEVIIKLLVALNAYVPLYRQFGLGTCEALLDAFRRHGPVYNLKKRSRRWSYDDRRQYHPDILANRCYYEKVLLLYLQQRESRIANASQDIKRHYNNSQLFENFVADVQQENRNEEENWSMCGKKFPYPKYHLKDVGDKEPR